MTGKYKYVTIRKKSYLYNILLIFATVMSRFLYVILKNTQ
jgi:hypothetical protein